MISPSFASGVHPSSRSPECRSNRSRLYTQPSEEMRKKVRDDYADDAEVLTQASQVIAINFHTITAANDNWRSQARA